MEANKETKLCYAVVDENGNAYDNKVHDSIEEAVSFADEFVKSRVFTTVHAYEQVPISPSGVSLIDVGDLLLELDERLEDNGFEGAEVADSLSDDEVKALQDKIDKLLDEHIKIPYYESGELVKKITLTKDDLKNYL
ncbi:MULTISPECIES: hypothetical protein [Snodgrassella]|uniref:hypothetical protein n=1 Tax=Snodgrassella TaxID=1193515 RepID=UPI0008159D9B|nr:MULTISPECIES: hypothetical protein [Snodgrassella]SCC08379.1 hypothetical protein GA0061082_10877 [Snodgrassella sp. R-53583]